VDAALEFLDMPVRPGQTERAGEMGAPLFRSGCAARVELILDPPHRGSEILARSRPPRRQNPGGARERIDRKARIVREGRPPCRKCGPDRLETGVLDKARAGLLGLDEPELACRYGRNA